MSTRDVTSYKTVQVGEIRMFYREAGKEDAPVLLLLHGFPTSSHMFRNLIPLLSHSFRVIAPDLPGFGSTEAPAGARMTIPSKISLRRSRASSRL